jgi:hypothetical protein
LKPSPTGGGHLKPQPFHPNRRHLAPHRSEHHIFSAIPNIPRTAHHPPKLRNPSTHETANRRTDGGQAGNGGRTTRNGAGFRKYAGLVFCRGSCCVVAVVVSWLWQFPFVLFFSLFFSFVPCRSGSFGGTPAKLLTAFLTRQEEMAGGRV